MIATVKAQSAINVDIVMSYVDVNDKAMTQTFHMQVESGRFFEFCGALKSLPGVTSIATPKDWYQYEVPKL